ncbi:MAG: hypothetical protein CVV44_10485 [Spirochaetae bacterium HGW-Spirochaetae-1]|nr:MAG: hypothetical protein CVV44_10485 [Spirochaetae bacterium HGW-Spirochaetae-1]
MNIKTFAYSHTKLFFHEKRNLGQGGFYQRLNGLLGLERKHHIGFHRSSAFRTDNRVFLETMFYCLLPVLLFDIRKLPVTPAQI